MAMKIGFIGQGFIGGNYADDFEERGFDTVRYSLEEPYVQNRDKIALCDLVLIAVPTPTTPDGFDDSTVREAVSLVGKGKIAIIKSTVVPGTTESIQSQYPDRILLHSPEFLARATAGDDARHPVFNIIGIPRTNDEYRHAAEFALSVLPKAQNEKICTSRESELFKYLRNCYFYTKILYLNSLYDLSEALDCDWGVFRELMSSDPWIADMHLDVVHRGGRGAGGPCFIKDYAALAREYEKHVGDELGISIFKANEARNVSLLKESAKDLDLLKGVYGEEDRDERASQKRPLVRKIGLYIYGFFARFAPQRAK